MHSKGCMPTKALLHAAELRHGILEGEPWGITAEHVQVDPKRVFARKDALIADFAGYRRQQLEDGRFGLIRSQARFDGLGSLRLADGRSIQFGHAVVATGSSVAPASLPGLEAAGYLTSDSALAGPGFLILWWFSVEALWHWSLPSFTRVLAVG